jgi:hypothetical protein
MPPLRTQISSNEGNILLAMSAIKSHQFSSISAATNAFNISKATLTRRINRGTSRECYTPHNKKLTLAGEEVLVREILKLDSQGLSPTTSLVKEMANTICHIRGEESVGINWAYKFIQRTPALIIKQGRAYECQRKLCKDLATIQEWFRLVQNTINKYGILPEDTYNFDETGFQMGQISTSKVVTAADRLGKLKQIKPTNSEWVTLIQGAYTDGSFIPPFLILKGKEFNQAWFHQLPLTWVIAVSSNGWTTNQLSLQWVQHFEKHTRSRTIGSKRLLILDNHESHISVEFRSFCQENHIILL